MILERLDCLSHKIFCWASRIGMAERVSEFEETQVTEASGSPSRLYRWVLRWQERGIFFRIEKAAFQALLHSRVSDIGVFFILWGTIELAWNGLFFGTFALVSLIRILSASVLLHSTRLCGKCVQGSRILRWFLFDFCQLSEDAFGIVRGRRTPLPLWIMLGGLIGVFGCVTSPMAATLSIASAVLLALLFAIPEMALLILLAALPFLNLLSHPTWWLFGGLCVCGFACLGKAISGKRQIEWGRTDWLALWLAFLYAMSGAVSFGSPIDGLLRGFLMLTGWFMPRILLTAPKWKRRATGALCISSFICSVVGILEYVMGKAPLGWVDTARFADIGGRVCSLFNNPNLFAVFLLFTVPLPLAGCFKERGMFAKWMSFFAFLTGSACLLLTWSRGAWLGWLVAVFLLMAVSSRRSFSLLLLGGAFAIAALPFLPPPVARRFQSIGNFADTSANYRLNTWRGVVRMLKSHPWGIGCGERAFRRVFPAYAVSGTEGVMHPHQVFLEVFSELGVVGFLFFALILLRLFKRFLCFCRTMPQGVSRAEGVALFCALAGGMVMGLFDSLWYHNGLFWLFWVVCAMCENLHGEVRK